MLEPIGWLREWRSVVSQPMPGCLSCVHPVASTNPPLSSVPIEGPAVCLSMPTVCLSKLHIVPVEAGSEGCPGVSVVCHVHNRGQRAVATAE